MPLTRCLPLCQHIGPVLEDKFDVHVSAVVPSLRANLVTKIGRAVEAHLKLDPDGHSPPRVEK